MRNFDTCIHNDRATHLEDVSSRVRRRPGWCIYMNIGFTSRAVRPFRDQRAWYRTHIMNKPWAVDMSELRMTRDSDRQTHASNGRCHERVSVVCWVGPYAWREGEG